MSAREHGFLFSAPMALANLSGAKTATRRAITRHRSVDVTTGKMLASAVWGALDWNTATDEPSSSGRPLLRVASVPHGWMELACRVRKGDRIWQRETWREEGSGPDTHAVHRADCNDECGHDKRVRWKPGIHMSRWACRAVFEVVTDPWPQRIGDITEEQCVAEGVKPGRHCSARTMFEALWISINGAWQPGAFVWVYQYRILEET